MIEIRHRITDEIIYTYKGESLIGADIRLTDLRWADLRGADLRETNLRRTALVGANLRGADLRKADLRGADLQLADLREADLREANLHGTNLKYRHIQGTKHSMIYLPHIKQLQIGGYIFPLAYWLENYETIGKYENYTEEEIKEYGNYIKMLEGLEK